MIERRLNEINEDKEPERDMLNLDTDEDEVDMNNGEHGSRLDNDHYGMDQMGYDDEDDDDMQDDDDDDMMGNGIVNTTDPQILKLQDRIKFFRHRCVASLGNNMYERAYEFLKESGSEGASAVENREGLIQILGEDSIGFWAILDQILFYEGMVDELSTINTSNDSGGS